MEGFRSASDAPSVAFNVGFNNGGLGDQIARMPAALYLAREYPHHLYNWWVPDYFAPLASHITRPIPNILVGAFSTYNTVGDKSLPALHCDNKNYTTLKTHTTKHAFQMMTGLDAPTPNDMNYPRFESLSKYIGLPTPYVVLTSGHTAKAREWAPQSINEVARYLNRRGFNVVWLGKKTSELGTGALIRGTFDVAVDYTVGVDLIDRTSLLDAAAIMGGAKAVVGVDNGLLHLAATTDVPIVGGFTSVDPNTRLPYRYGIMGWNYYTVVPEPSCRFCQTKMQFVYDHDFRNCFYQDYQCVAQLTSQKFITELEKFL